MFVLRMAGLLSALPMAIAALSATPAAAVITVSVEAPGVQTSTSRFDLVGIETFDTRSTGVNRSFTTDFGGSAFSGSYTGVQIANANQFGGAGGTGRLAITSSATGYSLDLTNSAAGNVNYFGFWLSALDNRNQLSFFRGSTLLFTFSATDARSFIAGLPGAASYRCNPNPAFAGLNCGEPYAFLNFYGRNGATFDRIVFGQSTAGAGLESDNHTVGQWNRMSGTPIGLPGSLATVPEPAGWALLLVGFGAVGGSLRRRRAAMPRTAA
jgi:hypothetical protein